MTAWITGMPLCTDPRCPKVLPNVDRVEIGINDSFMAGRVWVIMKGDRVGLYGPGPVDGGDPGGLPLIAQGTRDDLPRLLREYAEKENTDG